MTSWNLWECLSKENQEKLRSLAPPGWCPPAAKEPLIKPENTEEIGKLIRRPGHQKRGRKW